MFIFTAVAKLFHVGMNSVHCAVVKDEQSVSFDILPGPNMPSLASMGLTSASLYTQAYALLNYAESASGQAEYLANVLGEQIVPTLCMSDVEKPESAEALASFLYLHALGSTQCGIAGFNKTTLWVSSGDVYIWGKNVGTDYMVTHSHCLDVAIGLGQIITGCVLAQNRVSVGGQAVVKGNSDIAIQLGRSEQSNWSP